MSLWDEIRKRAQGVVAQINPFDGGQTFDTVVNNKKVVSQSPKAAPKPAVVSTAVKKSPAVQVPSVRTPSVTSPMSGLKSLDIQKPTMLKPTAPPKPAFKQVDVKNSQLATPGAAKLASTQQPTQAPVLKPNAAPVPAQQARKPVYKAVQRADKGFDLMRDNQKIDRPTYVRESGVDENKMITGFAEKGDRASQAYLAKRGKTVTTRNPLSLPSTTPGGPTDDMLNIGQKSALQQRVEAAAEARKIAQAQDKQKNREAIDEILTQTDNSAFSFLGGRSLRGYKDQYNRLTPLERKRERQRLESQATMQLTRENYSQKQQREEARAALAVIGEYGNSDGDIQTFGDDIVNLIPNMIKGTVDTYGRVNNANARVLDEVTVGSTRKLQESQKQGIDSLRQMRQSIQDNDARFRFMGEMSPEAQKKYDMLTKALERDEAIYREALAADYDVTDPTKYAGAGAAVILDALTAGVIGNVPRIAKGTGVASDAARVGDMIVNPQNIKQGLVSGTALGTGYGAASAFEQLGSDVTPDDVILSATQGALAGGLTAGTIMGISRGISKLSNNARNNLLRTASEGESPVDINVKDLYSLEGAPDRARVEEYKARIQNGGQIEPLYVMPDSKGRLTVEDGKHRLQAMLESGVDTAQAIVVSPSRVRNIMEGGYLRIPGGKAGDIDLNAMTPAQRRMIEQEIEAGAFESDPRLMQAAYEDQPSIAEDGSNTIPRIHVEDLRHYLGNLTEDIPARYRRTTGDRDIDLLAERAGFSDVDDFMDMVQQRITANRASKESRAALVALKSDVDEVTRAVERLERSEAFSGASEQWLESKNKKTTGAAKGDMYDMPKVLYHGTKESFDDVRLSTSKGNYGEDQIPGVYLVADKDLAESFARDPKYGMARGSVKELSVNPKKILAGNSNEIAQRLGYEDFRSADKEQLAKRAIDQGYNVIVRKGGINGKDEIIALDTNSVSKVTSTPRKASQVRDLEDFEYSQLDDDIYAMAVDPETTRMDIRDRLIKEANYPTYEIDDALSRIFREQKETGSQYATPRKSFEMTKGQYEPGTPGIVIKESKSGAQRERLYRNDKSGVAELVTETRNPDGTWSKKKGRNVAIMNANDFTAIDKVMDAAEEVLDATDSAKKAIEDGKELHFYARKQVGDPNNLSAEVIPFNPEKMIIDGGFVRSADTNEMLGNHIKVDDTGIQINIGKNIVNMGDVTGDTSKWKNMNKTTYTLDRMLEAAAPNKETYMKTRKFIVEHKQHSEANMRQDLAKYRGEIFDWQKKLNSMRPSSIRKKDFGTDIFRYSERKLAQPSEIKGKKLTQEAILKEKYGDKVANEIQKFDKWARKQYDGLLDRTNEVLREFGHDEVQKRQNYMTHLQEESFWDKIGIGEELYRDFSAGIQGESNMTNRGQLPGTIAGRTENFRPTKKYNPFHQSRRGNESMTDPFKAMDAYGEAALFNIHMTESATRARSLEAVFRAAEEILNRDMLQQVNQDLKDSLLKAHGGSRGDLVTAFQEYANALAGKSSRFDRPLQDSGTAGRTVLRVSRALQRIASQSSIIGNINSTLSQALNLPNVIGTMGIRSTTRGIGHLINDFGNDGMPLPGTPAAQSDFLKVRYTDAQSRIDRTKLQIANRGLTKILFMEQFERAMVESTWYAAHERALKTGFKGIDAVKEADRTTERLVAGRGIADQPEIYRSVVGKGFLQYTLEVNAALKNLRKDMKIGGVVKYAVAVYLMNTVYQTLTGRAPLPDFIGATVDTVKDFADADSYESETNEDGDNIGEKIMKAGQRYLGQATNLSPFTSALVNNVLDQDARKALFGPDSNFGRYDGSPAALGVVSRLVQGGIALATGDTGKAWDSALSALPYGGQIRKTGQGTEAMLNGYTKDGSGDPAASVDTSNPLVWVQAVLFGKNAIPEVKAYYENKQSALGSSQTETFKRLEKEQGKDAAREYLNAVQDNRLSSKEPVGAPGTVSESKNPNAEYEKQKRVKIAEGEWEEKDGVVVIKESGNVAKSYYEAKAKAAIESFDQSDDAYDAILKANDIKTVGSGKAKATGNGTLDKLSQLSDIADKADVASEAVKLIKNSGKDSKVPEWATKRYLKENGIDENQAVYAAKASYNNDAKGEVIRSDIAGKSHDEVMKYLTNGRIESITGSFWVTQGILADLRDEGVISKAEYKALNDAKYNSDGSPQASKTGSGGSGSSSKVSAAELGALTAGNDIASKVAKIIAAAAARRNPGKISYKKR